MKVPSSYLYTSVLFIRFFSYERGKKTVAEGEKGRDLECFNILDSFSTSCRHWPTDMSHTLSFSHSALYFHILSLNRHTTLFNYVTWWRRKAGLF